MFWENAQSSKIRSKGAVPPSHLKFHIYIQNQTNQKNWSIMKLDNFSSHHINVHFAVYILITFYSIATNIIKEEPEQTQNCDK